MARLAPGNVAKWAPLYGRVATFQTLRRFRVSRIALNASRPLSALVFPSKSPRTRDSRGLLLLRLAGARQFFRCEIATLAPPMASSCIASLSKKYCSDFDSRNKYSCALVQRSRTLSGIGFGLCQIMSWRRYQPSARSANASIQGMPIRSLGLMPSGTPAPNPCAWHTAPLPEIRPG